MCTIDLHRVLPGFVESQAGKSEVTLSFREGNLEGLSDALDLGEVDVGIRCSPCEIPKRFRATALFREDYVLAIGDDHRFHGREEIEMAALDCERYCERVMCEFSIYIERLLRGSSENQEGSKRPCSRRSDTDASCCRRR
jgi:DNA-binding transcriptional LysR family regulator